MGADLARAEAGKKTRTGMSADKLREFASTKRKSLPKRKKAGDPSRNDRYSFGKI